MAYFCLKSRKNNALLYKDFFFKKEVVLVRSQKLAILSQKKLS